MAKKIRDLNEEQHRALDRIANADPEARVIGWLDQTNFGRGPVVDGPQTGRALVNVTGRRRALV